MCASSSRASSRFWSCTRLRVTWYLRRITVRQSRCSASGTKLKVSSCATRRFTNRSASGKSFLRPPGPRFDCAWARWSVPASRGAPLRARRRGRQCCSSASHTGRQYCAESPGDCCGSDCRHRAARWRARAARAHDARWSRAAVACENDGLIGGTPFGCQLLVRSAVAEFPDGPLFWHLRSFETLTEAEWARAPQDVIAAAGGQAWLFSFGPESQA